MMHGVFHMLLSFLLKSHRIHATTINLRKQPQESSFALAFIEQHRSCLPQHSTPFKTCIPYPASAVILRKTLTDLLPTSFL